MSQTTEYGYRIPETGDPASSWMDDLADNWTRASAHDHDGTDSAQLTNSSISASAAIARSKLASGTAYRIIANSSAGVLSENAALTANHVVYADANGQLAGEAALSVSRGGTGQATATAAFNALSPLTTKGDLLTNDGTNDVRQAVGTNGFAVVADSAQTNGIKYDYIHPDEPSALANVSISTSVGSNILTVALKGKDGADASATNPIRVAFRSATAATGTYSVVSITGALSVAVPDTATLGHASGVAMYIYVYLLNNAGTAELALSSSLFDTGTIVSSTTIGTGSDSAATMYSTTGRSNVGCRLIGRLKSTQGTAGTWATAISEVSLPPFLNIVPAAYYYTAAGQTIEGAAETVDFGTKGFDTMNSVTTGASWVFTCPIPGLYYVSAMCSLTGLSSWNAGEEWNIYLFKNAGVYGQLARLHGQATHTTGASANGSCIVDCVAGTTLHIEVNNGSGTSAGLSADGALNNVSIMYIGNK